MKGFEVVQKAPVEVEATPVTGEIVPANKEKNLPTKGDKIVGALADGFPKILEIASDIVKIKAMREETVQYVKKLDAKTQYLKEHTKAYIAKVEADNQKSLNKMEQINIMLSNYYQHNNGQVPIEDFKEMLNTILDKVD